MCVMYATYPHHVSSDVVRPVCFCGDIYGRQIPTRVSPGTRRSRVLRTCNKIQVSSQACSVKQHAIPHTHAHHSSINLYTVSLLGIGGTHCCVLTKSVTPLPRVIAFSTKEISTAYHPPCCRRESMPACSSVALSFSKDTKRVDSPVVFGMVILQVVRKSHKLCPNSYLYIH